MDANVLQPPPRAPAAGAPACIVGAAAVASSAIHTLAAVSGMAGATAWLMTAMGVACLTCYGPILAARRCAEPVQAARRCAGRVSGEAAGRAAGHLLAMSVVMIFIHLVMIASPVAGSHHHSATPVPQAFASHDVAMLGVIGVEILCLMAASAALRLSRLGTPAHAGPQPDAVEQ